MHKNTNKKFIRLYDKQHAAIYRFLRIKVPSNEVAQDLTSETFTKAWDAISADSADYPDNDRAFLYRVARNLLTDYYRSLPRQKEHNAGDTSQVAHLASAPAGKAEDAMEQITSNLDITQEMQNITASLAQLPEETAEIVTMRYVQDLTNAEIAEILGKNEGAIRTALSRGLKQLRENYDK